MITPVISRENRALHIAHAKSKGMMYGVDGFRQLDNRWDGPLAYFATEAEAVAYIERAKCKGHPRGQRCAISHWPMLAFPL